MRLFVVIRISQQNDFHILFTIFLNYIFNYNPDCNCILLVLFVQVSNIDPLFFCRWWWWWWWWWWFYSSTNDDSIGALGLFYVWVGERVGKEPILHNELCPLQHCWESRTLRIKQMNNLFFSSFSLVFIIHYTNIWCVYVHTLVAKLCIQWDRSQHYYYYTHTYI